MAKYPSENWFRRVLLSQAPMRELSTKERRFVRRTAKTAAKRAAEAHALGMEASKKGEELGAFPELARSLTAYPFAEMVARAFEAGYAEGRETLGRI